MLPWTQASLSDHQGFPSYLQIDVRCIYPFLVASQIPAMHAALVRGNIKIFATNRLNPWPWFSGAWSLVGTLRNFHSRHIELGNQAEPQNQIIQVNDIDIGFIIVFQ